MKTFQYDTTNALVTSSNTDGGGASTSKSIVKMGTFWTSSNGMPTSDSPFVDLVRGNGGTQVDVAESAFIATSNGYINVLTIYFNGGSQGSDVVSTVYKNGTATSLTCTGNVAGQGVPGQAFYGNGGSTFTFVKGDLLKVKIRSANSSVNQSFLAALEVVNS